MLSLYVHVPFCDKKCGYCSFHVLETEKMRNESSILDHYVAALKKEIEQLASMVGKEEIKTIYLGGGTPSKLGLDRLCDIISLLESHFDLEHIGEISFECNPYPHASTIELVSGLQKRLKTYSRVRFSFGIQSFDNEILKESGRGHSFSETVAFLRDLQEKKKANSVYNLDFIAFGKFRTTKSGNKQLRDSARLDFFQNLVDSHFADGFSLYTLELFEGSIRYHDLLKSHSKEQYGPGLHKYGSDDDIYEEFSILKDILLNAGYRRYELSNFCLPGKSSIHNRAYREMENYVGLGTSASSFVQASYNHYQKIKDYVGIPEATGGLRWSNTKKLANYLKGDYVDQKERVALSQSDLSVEGFFLALRTDQGVSNLRDYQTVLVDNYDSILNQLVEQGFVDQNEHRVRLTDAGMDVYNEIATSLLKSL